MRRTAVWLSLLVTGAACVVLESRANASPQPIGVIAPAGSRLAGELKRELSAANLASVSMVTSDRDWPSEMIDLVSIPYLQGVVVGSNDGRMIVFSRGVTSGRIEVRLELSFDPNDRPARRRACLAAVEGLRALSETRPPPAPVLAWSSFPPPPPAVSSVAPPRSSSAPGPIALATPPASVTTRAPSPVSAPVPLSLPAPAPREPWVMGVGTMLDLDHTLGAPMGHLAFLWFIPVRARLSVRTQVMWPVMGTALGPNATGIRIWTFGAAVGMQYAFAPAQARLRPFVGLAGGSQLLLTDTSGVSPEVAQPRAPFVPSANLRGHSGVRVTIAPRMQLLAEVEATRDWLLQSSRDLDYRNSVANTLAFHASLGVLFEH